MFNNFPKLYLFALIDIGNVFMILDSDVYTPVYIRLLSQDFW